MLVKILAIVFLSFTFLLIIAQLILIRLMRNEITELRGRVKEYQKEKERMEIRESARREQMTLADAFEAMNKSMKELGESLRGFRNDNNNTTAGDSQDEKE